MARPIQSKQLNADVTVSQPTVAALEALPGPQATAPQLTWIQELEAFYVFVPGSVAVVDHFTVLGVTGGVAGRWILQSEAITLQPRGGGIDDQPTIQAAVNACAGVCSIVLGTGTFQIIAAQVTFPLTAPSILEWAGPETIVNCQLGGGHGACFLADAWTPRTTVTTLSAPTTFNSPNISTVGALPANGSKLVLVSGIVSGLIINATYTLISGGGTMNGVVDRGILKPFPGGATVASTAGFPTVQFIGNGGMIQGTGDFAIEILCGDHCLIDNLCLVSSFSRWGFNFDYCTNFSTMRRNRITYVANGASWACGMEQTENSCIEDTYIGPGFTGEAVAIDAIENGWVTGVEAPGSNCGILVQPIGPTDPRGTNNLLIQACVFAGSIDCGIKLVDANQNITVDACDTTGSANGLKVTLGNNTVYTSDLRVMNNCFVNSANSGVQVDGGNRHRYVNNDCSGSGTGLAVNGTGLCDDLQTVGLVANDCTGFGVIFLTTNVTGVRCWGTIAKRAAQWGCEVTCVDAEFYACDFTDGGYLTNVKGCIYVLANTPRVLLMVVRGAFLRHMFW